MKLIHCIGDGRLVVGLVLRFHGAGGGGDNMLHFLLLLGFHVVVQVDQQAPRLGGLDGGTCFPVWGNR